MGQLLSSPSDFHWSYTDEPHVSRRKEILAKYPQIKALYGYDWKTKFIVTFWVVLQIILCYLVRNSSWLNVVLLAYCVGAFPTHALFLAMHEISHNLAFPKPLQNRLLGCFANLVTFAPHFSMFQRYHMEHHQYQGVDGIDVDVPSRAEVLLFTNTLTKIFWVILQPLFYIIRPLLVKPKNPGFWEAINWSCTLTFDVVVLYLWGFKSFSYLFLCSFLSSGLHPAAGHFIAEHYVFVKGQETYSYYGPLNVLFFNVGYHNEHHDFPRIPGSRLPQLREIAAEFYDSLPHHDSWVRVIYNFITDPSIGPFARIKRKNTKVRTGGEDDVVAVG